jgi:hypothetical protein
MDSWKVCIESVYTYTVYTEEEKISQLSLLGHKKVIFLLVEWAELLLCNRGSGFSAGCTICLITEAKKSLTSIYIFQFCFPCLFGPNYSIEIRTTLSPVQRPTRPPLIRQPAMVRLDLAVRRANPILITSARSDQT